MLDSNAVKVILFIALMPLLALLGQLLHAVECWINPVQLSCM